MIINQITRRLFTRLVLAEGVSLMGESGQDHGNHMISIGIWMFQVVNIRGRQQKPWKKD